MEPDNVCSDRGFVLEPENVCSHHGFVLQPDIVCSDRGFVSNRNSLPGNVSSDRGFVLELENVSPDVDRYRLPGNVNSDRGFACQIMPVPIATFLEPEHVCSDCGAPNRETQALEQMFNNFGSISGAMEHHVD